MKKRGLSVLLTMLLCMGVCSVTAMATDESTASNWAEAVTVAPEGYTEDGSAVTISTAEGLAWFAKQVNAGTDYSEKTVGLSADIDLSGKLWIPVGTSTSPYKGIFDGGKHTISGLNVDITNNGAGLFGVVGGGTTIKNLEVSGAVKTSGKYAGGIVGNSSGTGLVTIENCGNKASVTAGGANAAGIIGCCDGSKATFVIRNCYNTGSISGGNESAAISGWLGNGAKVENCWNMGSVTGADSGKTFARFGTGPVFTNCHQLDTVGSQLDIYPFVEADLASGKLCGLLGSAWGQVIGTDPLPSFTNGTDTVYIRYEAGSCLKQFTNDGTIGVSEPTHDNSYGTMGKCVVCDEIKPGSIYETGLDLTNADEDLVGVGWSWVADGKVLTLTDFQLSTPNAVPLKTPHGTTVILSGTNKIASTAGSATSIQSTGSLTLKGADDSAKLYLSVGSGTAISCSGNTENVTLKIENLTLETHPYSVSVQAKTDKNAALEISGSNVRLGQITVAAADASKTSKETVKFSISDSVFYAQCSGANVNTATLTGNCLDVDIHNSDVTLWNSGWGASHGHAYAMRLNGKNTTNIDFSDSNLTFYSMHAGLWSDTFSDNGYSESSIRNCTIVTYSKAEAALCFMDNDTDADNYGNDNVTADVLNSYVDDCILLQCSSMEQPAKTVKAAIMGSPVIKQDFALAKGLGSVDDLSEYIADVDGFTLQSGESITVAEGVEVTLDEAFTVTVEAGTCITGQINANIVPAENVGILILHDGETTNVVSTNAEGMVQRPADPERQCYSFGGWYTDETYETEYDFSKAVTGTTHAYTKWIESHRWENGEITTHATCLAMGVRTYTCQDNSAHTKTEDVEINTDAHSFSADWTYDSTNHWHESTCGHDVIADEATHDFGSDRSCDTCGYTKQTSVGYPVYEPTYTPSIEKNEGGKVTVSNNTPTKGDTVTITPVPDEGYAVGEVTVTDSKGDPVELIDNDNGTYSFVQPAGKVTISVTYVEDVCDGTAVDNCPSIAFGDLDTTKWYHEATDYVIEKGLFKGVSEDSFAPDGSMTRAMFWTVLARIAEVELDESGAVWYESAMNWAVEEGISDGTMATDSITREQIITMLWRFMGRPDDYASLNGYGDADEISDWAVQAMRWAVACGIAEGYEDGTLRAGNTATRTECAALMMRFCENIM